jgi:hypothetical protein
MIYNIDTSGTNSLIIDGAAIISTVTVQVELIVSTKMGLLISAQLVQLVSAQLVQLVSAQLSC